MEIKREDYIYVDSWSKMCDYIYDGDTQLPKKDCVVYVPLDQIVKFFRECKKTDYKYIVVSGCSDYCLCYQENYPVQADTVKWLDFIDWQREIIGYEDTIIRARCYKHQCKIKDEFSLRHYSFTGHTFDDIPKNIVKWYSTNCNVFSKVATAIPFGIPDWEEVKYAKPEDKIESVYLNFMMNTTERSQLLMRYTNDIGVVRIEGEVPHSEYYTNLTKYSHVLCPEGNGLDCYRNLEAIYSGCVPIIVTNHTNLWASVYGNCNINVKRCDNVYFDLNGFQVFFDKCKLSYWKQIIEDSRNILL
jgi:hypothetical protein